MTAALADQRRRPWLATAGLALVVLVLVGVGCRSWGRGKDFEPLSAEEFDNLYLKRALGLLIHEALTEASPEALRRFFPPSVQSQVDCQAFYEQVMGAPPGVYQPRFWDMKLLEIQYTQARTRARTSLTMECADLRPGAGGAGRFVPLALDWVKQTGSWYLEPPPGAVTPEAAPD